MMVLLILVMLLISLMLVMMVMMTMEIKKFNSRVLARGEGRGPTGIEDRGEPGEEPGD